MQEQLQRNKADQQAEARQLFSEVAQGLHRLDANCPDLSEVLVTQASMLLDLRGSEALRPLERDGLDRLAARIGEACKQPSTASEQCLANHQRMQADLCTLVQRPLTPSIALNYWHPGTSPDDQARAARVLWSRWAMRLRRGEPDVAVAGPAADAVPRGETPHVAPASPALSLAACERADRPVNLYLQVYDEASRRAAGELRQRLQDAATASHVRLQVAPVENVGRIAELRQRRRPVPWAQPTFVVHDPPGLACASALSRLVGAPWVEPGQLDKVWVRSLPETLKGSAGTIELWLPPVGAQGENVAAAG